MIPNAFCSVYNLIKQKNAVYAIPVLASFCTVAGFYSDIISSWLVGRIQDTLQQTFMKIHYSAPTKDILICHVK